MKIGMTGFYVQLYRCYAGSILASVVLLFHQEVQLIQAPHHGSILLKIIGEWLSQPDISQATFVLYFITHG
jgi:hypothetical protein